jgi:hypothetical protein
MVQINDFGKILDKIIILLLVMVVGFLNGFHFFLKKKEWMNPRGWKDIFWSC